MSWLPIRRLYLNCKLLRRSIRLLGLRTNFSHPRIFWRRLLCKNIDLICCHAFLSNYNFFRTIYYEIASLIKWAIFSMSHSLHLIQFFQMTEFWSKHNWNFTDRYFFFNNLFYYLLYFFFSIVRDRIFFINFIQFFLSESDISKNFSMIS